MPVTLSAFARCCGLHHLLRPPRSRDSRLDLQRVVHVSRLTSDKLNSLKTLTRTPASPPTSTMISGEEYTNWFFDIEKSKVNVWIIRQYIKDRLIRRFVAAKIAGALSGLQCSLHMFFVGRYYQKAFIVVVKETLPRMCCTTTYTYMPPISSKWRTRSKGPTAHCNNFILLLRVLR